VIIFFIVNIFCNHVSISHMVLGITRLMVIDGERHNSVAY